ncbi:MAG: hypoxanthine phosphoribosyltransferase [Deltaproteobacteria bacterium]|nr:hypoxanthine phosphoribosyltransferase [Deltaproteobacteria bacterium]
MDEAQQALTRVISRERIHERVRDMARDLSTAFSGKEPLFIGVLNGAVFFLADLVRELTIPCRIDFIKAASYGTGTTSSGKVRLTKEVDLEIGGEDVILVEDIVDTGLTLKSILEQVEQKGPASVHVCALIDKRECRTEEIRVDFSGFEVERGFLVGYGLDCNERHRNLPDIYALG